MDRVYIDGIDIYAAYGVIVAKGGYNDLVSFPPMKTVPNVDWGEEDGIEPDLTDPKLDTKEVSINFAALNSKSIASFFDLLSDKSYHTFDFRGLGKIFKLRMISEQSTNICGYLTVFTLRFADDFPVSDSYVYLPPLSSFTRQQGYRIDGKSLTDYGIVILQGSEDEILKSPAVKINLLRNVNSQNGAIYDGQIVKFQSKDVKLSCLMQAKNPTEFWRNYDAFLFDLVRSDERLLYFNKTGEEYKFYYKSCNTTEFHSMGKIWFKFDLTLVFTSFRPTPKSR